MSSKWIDHIFYINLDKRVDRREHIESHLTKYNLFEKAERYVAIPTPHSGIIGCSGSHLNVLKIAKERNYKNVLILEDDFQFILSKEEIEEKIERFFTEKGETYDLCMLSSIIQKTENMSQDDPSADYLKKVLDGQTASGYFISHRFLPKLIELYEWSYPLLQETNHHWLYANDMVWKKLQPTNNWYYFSPQIGRQLDGYSDNKECVVHYE